MTRCISTCSARDLEVVHEGQIGGPQGRMAYFDAEHLIGTALEISEPGR